MKLLSELFFTLSGENVWPTIIPSVRADTALPTITLKDLFVILLCDTVIYNKKYTFGHPSVPGTELLKLIEFPMMRGTKVSFVMLQRLLLGLQLRLKGLREDESVSSDQWFNESCSCQEASIKAQKVWRASRLVDRWRLGVKLSLHGKLHSFSYLTVCMSFIRLFPNCILLQ